MINGSHFEEIVLPRMASLILVFTLVMLWVYKYNGNTRWPGFRNWISNTWRRCKNYSCTCTCVCRSDNESHVEPGESRGEVIASLEIPSIHNSAAIFRTKELTAKHQALKILNIDNFEGSPLMLERSKLTFTSQYGQGWFGPILRGTLNNLSEVFEPAYNYEEATTTTGFAWREPDVVIIQQLKEEAKLGEQAIFFRELKPAALAGTLTAAERHPNVLSLVGLCLDKPPLLSVLEHCSHGDLKTFLKRKSEHHLQMEKENLLLGFSRDIASGVAFLHQKNCIPPDLAARTCQVDHTFSVKVGDYGNARALYPGDYISCDLSTTIGFTSPVMSYRHRASYLPLRWMAPEFIEEIQQTKSTEELLLKEGSKCQSIWSLGITLWEIYSMGETPFKKILDHEFLRTAVLNGFEESAAKGQLPGPTVVQGETGEVILDVIEQCLKVRPEERTTSERIANYLRDLYTCHTQETYSI